MTWRLMSILVKNGRKCITRSGASSAIFSTIPAFMAVNGQEVKAPDNVHRFLEGTAGKRVVLRVGPDADGANARELTVVPVEDEAALRNRAWIDDNLRKVNELTKGRVAYVYLPDTAV